MSQQEHYLTEFGKAVRHRLIDLDQSQSWLIKEVRKKTGKFLNSGYLAAILYGTRKSSNIKKAICEILELSEDLCDE